MKNLRTTIQVGMLALFLGVCAAGRADVEAVSAVEPQQNTKIDISKMTREEMYAPVENPQSIKDFFVNNLFAAAKKVKNEYNGTKGQQSELAGLLESQAIYCKINNEYAFFSGALNSSFEKELAVGGTEVAKNVASKVISTRLPEIQNYPVEQKLAGEFTAVVTLSLHSAIEARAAKLKLASDNK